MTISQAPGTAAGQPASDLDDATSEALHRAEQRVTGEWPEKHGVIGWLTTVDHKRIGRRYMVTAALFFTLAGINALVMRAQLARPDETLVSPNTYDQLFTLHGTAMIFFFATPMLFGFGNFLFPLMLGTRDMAFPRLNAFGYWVFASAGLVMFSSLLFGRAPNGGWFSYVPLTSSTYTPQANEDVYSLGLLFLGVSTTAGAINFIATALKLRAPGMTLARVPVFVWSVVVTSFMVIFALPPLNAANALLFLDRRFGTWFFNPKGGGDVILWQHLFWLFGHPDVYIIVLPALGIVSSIVPTFSRRPIAAYSLVVLATIGTGIISFGVWVHHMFAVGLPQLALSFFSAASVIVTIPSGIQMFAWLSTMLMGRIVLSVPLLWVVGFIVTFVMGGVTGVMFALVPFDQQVTDSYFVVAHFHYVLFGGAVMPIIAGLYYWWPKFTGKMTSRKAGVWGFWLVLIGFHVTFFPMHLLGLLGMPRRIYTWQTGLGWSVWNMLASVGAGVLLIGLLTVLGSFAYSLRRGAPAPADPWGGDTLEWATSSPPPAHNFTIIPTVHSLHPMWDAESRASLVEGARDEHRVLAEGHEVLRSTELDAEPEHALEMPEDSWVPLVTAAGLLIGVLGLLLQVYPLAGAGGVLVAGTMLRWLWPAGGPPRGGRRESEGGPKGSGTGGVLEARAVATEIPRGRTPAWWGMVLFVATEGTLFATLLASYFYLRFTHAGAWPPGGIKNPELSKPLIMTAILVSSSGPMIWADWAVRHGKVRQLKLGLMLTMALGLSFLALQTTEFLDKIDKFTWSQNVYGSLFYTITGFHGFHVITGLIMVGFTLAGAFRGKFSGQRHERVRLVSFYWHFIDGVWIFILFSLYLSPHL